MITIIEIKFNYVYIQSNGRGTLFNCEDVSYNNDFT